MKNMSGEAMWRIFGPGILGIVALIVVAIFFGGFFAFVKIEGDQIGVVQDWNGVKNQTLGAGMHLYNNFIEDVHIYPIGTQKMTFAQATELHQDVEFAPIPVEIGENGGQEAWISMSINYHLNPEKIVALHKRGIGKTYEAVILKREVVQIVNTVARPNHSALDIYSGAGFVKFMDEVGKQLQENKELKESGIEVENTIIYNVHLDPAYEKEIAAKQIAQQQALRKVEETKAAEQEAKRIFALSQATVEQARQDAEAKKITQVTAAEASARKTVLDAEAERDSNLARASGELAVGKARAEVKQLERDAQYAGESGARLAQVEIAEARAKAAQGMFQGVKILPGNLAAIGAASFGIGGDVQESK